MEATNVQYVHRDFLPAAGRDWLLPLYDPFTRLVGFGGVHGALIEQAQLVAGQTVLDVGAGTGSLAVRIRREHPEVEVAALDPDPKALAIARKKAERAGVKVRFEQGYGDSLPFADASFDSVLSSMMFHHLDRTTKLGMLRDVRRVLRPGGSFHLADFGRSDEPQSGLLARLLHHSHQLDDSADATIEALLADAGFADGALVAEHRTLLGRVARHAARR
jgi:ubiquinone/menaquinone biosynthesis C-methylase UbiE